MSGAGGASLELSWALGATENIASLIGCMSIAAHCQQWERAARLCGAVEILSANLNRPFTPLQQADYNRAVGSVRARRHESAVTAAWAKCKHEIGPARTFQRTMGTRLAFDLPSDAAEC